MPSEAIVCPSCRGPVTSGPNANGQYTCGYCGTPFHRNVAQSPPIVVNVNHGGGHGGPAPQGGQSGNSGAVVAAVVVVVMLIGGVVGMLMFGSSSAESDHAAIDVPAFELEPVGSPAAREAVKVAPGQAAKAVAEVPASATFEFHAQLSGYQSSYYALGIVTNTSPFVIGHPKVNAVLLDADGKEVGTDFGFAARDSLAPEQSSAIKILINDPPPHASVRYEVVVKKASYVPKEVTGLRVEAMEPQAARYGDNRWEIEGKVFNEGEQGAKFVEIEILARDAEGKLIGVDSTYADGDELAPGATARFKALSVSTAGPVDHFEFSVSGRPPS